MDLTYRTELRELNELNFARFDAKVGERLAELRADLEHWFQAERRTESQMLRGEMDVRFVKVDERLEKVDKRLEALADQIRDSKTSIIKWVIGLWIGTALAGAGSRLFL
jgi:hypothetical protein